MKKIGKQITCMALSLAYGLVLQANDKPVDAPVTYANVAYDVHRLKWDSGLLSGNTCKAGRYTFSTNPPKSSELQPAGLIGLVQIQSFNKP